MKRLTLGILVALMLLPAGAAAYPSKGGGIAGNSTPSSAVASAYGPARAP